MLTLFMFSVLGIGAFYMIWRQPLSHRFGISMNWEIGLSSLVIIGFCFYLATEYWIPRMIERDLAEQPCGRQSVQATCYNLTHSICELAWHTAETSCKSEFAAISQARPTALIGPGLNRCKARRMDQTLRLNRIHEDSPYCKAYFNYIDERN